MHVRSSVYVGTCNCSHVGTAFPFLPFSIETYLWNTTPVLFTKRSKPNKKESCPDHCGSSTRVHHTSNMKVNFCKQPEHLNTRY